jgi:WD40 repeat protein
VSVPVDSGTAATLAPVGASGSQRGGTLSVALTADGRTLVTGNADGSLTLWDPSTAALLHRVDLHHGPVVSLALAADGATLAAGCHDGTAVLWDLPAWSVVASVAAGTTIDSVAFTADAATLLTGVEDQQVLTRSALDGSSQQTIDVLGGAVNGVAGSPLDPTAIAVGSADWSVRQFSLADGSQGPVLRGHTAPVFGVAFSPDGTVIASASADTTVRLWDVTTSSGMATLSGHTESVTSVAFVNDVVLSCSDDGTLRLWDVASTALLATLTGNGDPVPDLAVSADGTTVATSPMVAGPEQLGQALTWQARQAG